MRVSIPDALSAGVIDLRDYGEGQVPVEADESGHYVDVDSEAAARAVADAYGGARIGSDAEPDTGESEPAAGTCSVTLKSGQVCARELPCQYHGMEGA